REEQVYAISAGAKDRDQKPAQPRRQARGLVELQGPRRGVKGKHPEEREKPQDIQFRRINARRLWVYPAKDRRRGNGKAHASAFTFGCVRRLRLGGALLFLDPRIHLLLQNVEGQRAGAQYYIMKLLEVEVRAQTLLRPSAQLLDLQFAGL